MRPNDQIMAEQIAYYRHRAAEYDATAYGDTATATARIDSIVAGLGASGSVLELACGTGMWTQSLARHAAVLTALDSSPEAVAIARQRTANPTVRFVEADVFSWVVRERFDLIFFAFLLSHIPSAQLEPVLKRVGDWLALGGRVVFVDEHIRGATKEGFADGEDEIVVRVLADGSQHRLVKVFVDPPVLSTRLAKLGWQCVITDLGDWVLGTISR
jgi:SAM-dependent methyltransferase